MRILISGASGLIGSALSATLHDDGHDIRALVRRTARNDDEYQWHPRQGIVPPAAITWADAVINLSGASLGRLPWTPAYRLEILRSRVSATRTLAKAIVSCQEPPAVWLNASAVGYYGNRPGEVLTENSSPGQGFLAGVVNRWEAETLPAQSALRVVHARTGLVLSESGALQPLYVATRWGLGSTVGLGTHYWPWISLTDEVNALRHLLTHSTVIGPVNLVGPTPALCGEITRDLAKSMHRPHLLRLPRTLLSTLLGEAADELLLADQRVSPQRLLDDGFKFTHQTPLGAFTAMK